LEKEEVSEQDMTFLTRKAIELGMEPEEFTLLWGSMVTAKKRAGKKSLFRKPNYDTYFSSERFNNDFDDIFLTQAERDRKMMDEMNVLSKFL